MMYFNNDIKINKFKNESDFKSCLTCLLRTDSAQRWTNDLTSKMNYLHLAIQQIQVYFTLSWIHANQ